MLNEYILISIYKYYKVPMVMAYCPEKFNKFLNILFLISTRVKINL